jgi:Family of unknown function (DUF6395)
MKIHLTRKGARLRYTLELASDDRSGGERAFEHLKEREIRLAHSSFHMELPFADKLPHPDLHGAALFHMLRPFLGETLELPFAISESFADKIRDAYGVSLSPIDGSITQRSASAQGGLGLLFSGGLDSAAATLLLPETTPLLMLDRIPRRDVDEPLGDAIIDMVHPRALYRHIKRSGRPGYRVQDGHEQLFEPYPTWHTEMSRVAALYTADALDLAYVETGDVLDVTAFKGYHAERDLEAWTFTPPRSSTDEADGVDPKYFPMSWVGLTKSAATGGLSEVGTSRLVHESPYKGKTASCYYTSKNSFCMACDKCFKKILLHYIFDEREVPEALFEHFISQRHLADIFEKRFFDWHHVWVYIFQNLKCRHPFVKHVQAQAQRGTDLGFLERYYPPMLDDVPQAYRSAVRGRIDATVGFMSDDDVRALETLDVPPVYSPYYRGRHAAPASAKVDTPEAFRLLDDLLRDACEGETFAGYRLSELKTVLGKTRVTLRFTKEAGEEERALSEKDADTFTLFVQYVTHQRRWWKQAGRLALTHDAATPIDSDARRHAADEILKALSEL